MKLELRGCGERYTVEQSMLNLFPGELPVYGTISEADDDAWARITLREDGDMCRVTVETAFRGRRASAEREAALSGTAFRREGQRRRLIGQCFYLAAVRTTDAAPPWGMLSGVRPDKLVTKALLDGRSPAEARAVLEQACFVSPDRAALALETGSAAYRAARALEPRDIAVYVGIPFCPTRCAYCSFVSQSVGKSLGLTPPYVDALEAEIRAGGDLVRRLGLRVRALYMGGGTPTTLDPDQLRRILTALAAAFDLSACAERTVEAGRPDTITAEKLAVLRDLGVTRLCVNPQSMEDRVLRAVGRPHTAADTERAAALAMTAGFPHLNMDLIAGLPEDTPAGFARSLARCLDLGPDNLTVHTLALKKGSRVLTEGLSIPDAAAVGEMLDAAAPALRNAGYAPYYLYRQKYMSGSFENTGWSRPGAECLYNICMMSELCTILSFGAGGVTKFVEYPRNRIQRVFHPKYPREYLDRTDPGAAVRAAAEAFYRAAG